MIINTEVQDTIKMPGTSGKRLVVSYIGPSHGVEYLTYDIPEAEMYVWTYAGRNDYIYPEWQSWDFRPVAKKPSADFLPDSRVKEILTGLHENFPNTDIINQLYEPDTAYTDIEVDVDDEGFPDPVNVRNPVNTISWVHNDKVTVLGRKPITEADIAWIQKSIDEHCAKFKTKYTFNYEYFENEVDMLLRYINFYMVPAPCITGWNYFGYDYPYIYNRAALYHIDLNVLSPTKQWYKYKPWKSTSDPLNLPKHKLLFDYMEIFDKWDRIVDPKENTKLDWVSEKVLGIKKVVHQLGFKQEWEQKPVEYIFYNAVDSILVRELDLALKTSSAFFGLANLMHIPALNAFSPVRSIESVQVEYLYKNHRVMPLMKKRQDEDSDYEGAFVFQPVSGIYKNVLAMDFASLYPSTQRQFNISPDTFICKDPNRKCGPNEIKTVSGAVYRKDIKGFIVEILDDYFAQRKKYKKEMLIAYEEKEDLDHIYEKRFGKSFLKK